MLTAPTFPDKPSWSSEFCSWPQWKERTLLTVWEWNLYWVWHTTSSFVEIYKMKSRVLIPVCPPVSLKYFRNCSRTSKMRNTTGRPVREYCRVPKSTCMNTLIVCMWTCMCVHVHMCLCVFLRIYFHVAFKMETALCPNISLWILYMWILCPVPS